MKFKIIIITTILGAGMLFTGCEKEESQFNNLDSDSHQNLKPKRNNLKSQSPLVLLEEYVGTDSLFCKWEINNDSILEIKVKNNFSEGSFRAELNFQSNTINSYNLNLERNSDGQEILVYHKNQSELKIMTPTENGLVHQTVMTLPLEEAQKVGNYFNLAKEYIDQNYQFDDILSYGTINDGTPRDPEPDGKYVIGCASAGGSLSLAVDRCVAHQNVLLAACRHVGTDCACAVGDFLCVCVGWFDC